MSGFRTERGDLVPAITAAQMREVDRLAVARLGLGVLQMMENAGRNLAANAIEMMGRSSTKVVVLAGGGGNGGGGLCAARHLLNRGWDVQVVLDRDAEDLSGPAAVQFGLLRQMGIKALASAPADEAIMSAELLIDALIGYSLRGAPRGRAAELIARCDQAPGQMLALDVPSGLDATTGQSPGAVIRADRTLTLALPKTGLRMVNGEVYLADIGIPSVVYRWMDIGLPNIWDNAYWLRIWPV